MQFARLESLLQQAARSPGRQTWRTQGSEQIRAATGSPSCLHALQNCFRCVLLQLLKSWAAEGGRLECLMPSLSAYLQKHHLEKSRRLFRALSARFSISLTVPVTFAAYQRNVADLRQPFRCLACEHHQLTLQAAALL